MNVSGRRGFSVRNGTQIGIKTRDELLDYFYQQSVNLVWQGMASGISSGEILDQLKAAVGDVYRYRAVRLIFFECNQHDATEMGRGLIDTLGVPVEYRILDDFYSDLAGIIQGYDLIITTYHHLAEITETLGAHGEPPGKVIGIETRPAPETMLKVARLPNPHIGLVCNIPTTTHMLKHIFYGYHPEWEIEATAFEHPETVKEIARSCDHLIVTHTCAAEVTALTGLQPDVVVNFQIDEQLPHWFGRRTTVAADTWRFSLPAAAARHRSRSAGGPACPLRRPSLAPRRGLGLCDHPLHKLSMAGRLVETAAQKELMNIEPSAAREQARSHCRCRIARVQRC